MDSISRAFAAVWTLILDIIGAVIGVIALIEDWLHHQLAGLGIAPPLQSLILIAAAVILVLIAFRVLGGLLRVLLVLLLILFAVHVAIPLIRP